LRYLNAELPRTHLELVPRAAYDGRVDSILGTIDVRSVLTEVDARPVGDSDATACYVCSRNTAPMSAHIRG